MNIYSIQFLPNKYTNWYMLIIEKAKSENRIKTKNCNLDSHHIIPKSIGGLDTKENRVLLTCKEHFICHLLLTKMVLGTNKKKMLFAINRMINCNRYTNVNSSLFCKLKLQSNKYIGDIQRDLLQNNIHVFQINHPSKKLISEGIHHFLTNNPSSNAVKNGSHHFLTNNPVYNQIKEGKNKFLSSEFNKNVQLERIAKGEHNFLVDNPGKATWTCEHCNKQGKGIANYNRWHGNNCKY